MPEGRESIRTRRRCRARAWRSRVVRSRHRGSDGCAASGVAVQPGSGSRTRAGGERRGHACSPDRDDPLWSFGWLLPIDPSTGARRRRSVASARPHAPIVSWLPGYTRRWLPGDLLAALVVTALVVPQALGYAAIAGVPLQVGLYAVPLALVAYAVLGSSPNLVVGPASTVAVVSGSLVAELADGDQSRAVALTAALALVAGLALALAGLLRVGWLAEFLSKSIVTGFVFGLALTIVIGEIPTLLGFKGEGNTAIVRAWNTLADLGETERATVLVGLAALVLLFGGRPAGSADPVELRGGRRGHRGVLVARPQRPGGRRGRRGAGRAPHPRRARHPLRRSRPGDHRRRAHRPRRRGGRAQRRASVRVARQLRRRLEPGAARCRRGERRGGPLGWDLGGRQPLEDRRGRTGRGAGAR